MDIIVCVQRRAGGARIHHRKGSLLGMHGQALSSAPGQAAAGLAKGRGEREHHGGAHNIQHRDAHGNIIGEYGSSTWTTEERIERGLIDNRSYLQKSRSVCLFFFFAFQNNRNNNNNVLCKLSLLADAVFCDGYERIVFL